MIIPRRRGEGDPHPQSLETADRLFLDAGFLPALEQAQVVDEAVYLVIAELWPCRHPARPDPNDPSDLVVGQHQGRVRVRSSNRRAAATLPFVAVTAGTGSPVEVGVELALGGLTACRGNQGDTQETDQEEVPHRGETRRLNPVRHIRPGPFYPPAPNRSSGSSYTTAGVAPCSH